MVAAQVFDRIDELEKQDSEIINTVKDEKPWYHPYDHWWEVSDSEDANTTNLSAATATAIPPCKDQLPAPPRSLNMIDKSKYQMENFLHNGELIEEKKN